MRWRRGVPGPFARWLRTPVIVVAVLLLGLTTVLSTLLQQQARSVLATGLDENWRGAFDLLLSPADRAPALCRTDAGVRVAPNYASGAAGAGLTLADLEVVRAVEGVEVAAPIGLVGIVQGPVRDLALHMGEPEGLWAAQVETGIVLDDGVQEVPLSRDRTRLLWDPEVVGAINMDVGAAYRGEDIDWSASASVGFFPPTSQLVIAVDPVAERELLGEDGNFLTPLVRAGELTSREMVQDPSPDVVLGWGDPGWSSLWVEEVYSGAMEVGDRLVPVVVNTDPEFLFKVDIEAHELQMPPVKEPWESHIPDGPAMPSPALEQALQEASVSTQLGTSKVEYDEEFIPFAERPATITPEWVSATGPDGGGSSWDGLSINRTVPGTVAFEPTEVAGEDCAMRAVPVGEPEEMSWPLVPPGHLSPVGRPGGTLTLQNYRDTTVIADGWEGLGVTIIGHYSSSAVDSRVDQASYVPLGAYEASATTVLGEDPATSGDDLPHLRPPINALGVTSASAGAITDLEGGRDLVGRDAIDAVRVRVAGLSGYDEEGRAKVLAVATELEDLGYAVNVVAGSSRGATLVHVPDYFVDADSSGSGNLGWVSQEWSTVGAAATVEQGLSRGAVALLVLALASSSALTLTVLAFSGLARRREVAVLAGQSWQKRNVLSWLGGELAVGAVALAALCGLAWLLGARSPNPAPALGITLVGVLIAYAVGSAGMVWLAVGRARQRQDRARSSRTGLTWAWVTLRLMRTQPMAVLVTVTGTITLALATAAVIVAVHLAQAEAGASRLGVLLSGTILPAYLALAGVGIIAALGMVWTGRRVLARARTATTRVLTAAGWAQGDIRGLWDREVILLGALALLVGPLAAGLLAAGVDVPWVAPTLTAVVAVLAAILVALLAHRKGLPS